MCFTGDYSLLQVFLHECSNLLLQRVCSRRIEDFDLVGEHDVEPAEGAETVYDGVQDPMSVIFLIEFGVGEMVTVPSLQDTNPFPA